MSDPSAFLAPIREREAAATRGPWTTTPYGPGDHAYDGMWVTSLDREVIADMTTDLGEDWEQDTRANLSFIASARTDVPRLLSALDKVLALHRRGRVVPTLCVEDGQRYPCPTVAAAAHQADMLAANGYGKLAAAQLAARDRPESMEAARAKVRADRRATQAETIRKARAAALEDAADDAFKDKSIQGLKRVLIGNYLRARAVTERGGE